MGLPKRKREVISADPKRDQCRNHPPVDPWESATGKACTAWDGLSGLCLSNHRRANKRGGHPPTPTPGAQQPQHSMDQESAGTRRPMHKIKVTSFRLKVPISIIGGGDQGSSSCLLGHPHPAPTARLNVLSYARARGQLPGGCSAEYHSAPQEPLRRGPLVHFSRRRRRRPTSPLFLSKFWSSSPSS